MLVAVIFMMALLVIAMSVAAPKIARSIQRDRELETMHRGKQYARAVKLYYKKFGAYPPNVDALVKTNEIRFLRKKYLDPMTGKDDWKPVHYGQNKAPTAMGFFGQPLTGAGMGGGGPVATFAAPGLAGPTGSSILTGAESAEKMLRPVPRYSTSSVCASLSKCTVGSRPGLESFSASAPAVLLLPAAAV